MNCRYQTLSLAALLWVVATGCKISPATTPTMPPLPNTAVIMAVQESRTASALAAPGMALTVTADAPPFMVASEPVPKRGRLRLAWTATPDATVTGYRLYYGTNSGSSQQSATVGSVTNAALTGLDEGTRYFIVATSYNAAGVESEVSNEATGVTAIHVSLRQERWLVETYGLLGRTNLVQVSTNLTTWETMGQFVGDGTLRSFPHTNCVRAWFRVEAL
jgi:hypothetical protein